MKSMSVVCLLTLAAALSIPWESSQSQSKSNNLPECKIRGKIDDEAHAEYSYHKDGFSWLIFRFPVDGIATSGLTMKGGFSSFIEINVKKLKDGKPDKFFSTMLYVGEAVSNSTGKPVENWVSTVTYGKNASTSKQINLRGSFLRFPKYFTRFGGVGGRTTAPEEFVTGLREGRDMSFSAYNKDSPSETLKVTLDMENGRKYFNAMEQQDAIIRRQVSDGTCRPV